MARRATMDALAYMQARPCAELDVLLKVRLRLKEC